jgi:hypothetical protein
MTQKFEGCYLADSFIVKHLSKWLESEALMQD